MAYQELEHVLSPARESFYGVVNRAMAVAALAVGMVGALGALALSINPYYGFFGGLVLGVALTWPIAGVAVCIRALLLAVHLGRSSMRVSLGSSSASSPTSSPRVIKTRRGDRVVPVIKRIEQ